MWPHPPLFYIVSSPDCSRHGAVRMTTCTCGARTYMITFLAKVVANSSLYQGVPPPSENPESAPGTVFSISLKIDGKMREFTKLASVLTQALGFDFIGRLYLAYSPCGWAIIFVFVLLFLLFFFVFCIV